MKTRLTLIAYLIVATTICYSQTSKDIYSCKPCDLACDSVVFKNPGKCPHCNMKLVAKEELNLFDNLVVNEIKIETGSGVFLIEGGVGHPEKIIRIYYHKPRNFTPNSKVLMVIPGSGRDGDEYRDSWIEASEKYNVLILSPMYAEQDYDFGNYHLGGLLYNLNLESCVTFKNNSNIVELDEAEFKYSINLNAEEWIFNDFVRLFDSVVKAIGSTQLNYDMFGHSAGGQILHRFVLFHPQSKANRILASNSGFYTLPDLETSLPFGLGSSPIKNQNLKASYKKELILFLGELDNQNETGGLMLRSLTVDKQGTHRLERGKFFFKQGIRNAKEINANFNWKLEIIPQVGHDFRKMATKAAIYLYEIAE